MSNRNTSTTNAALNANCSRKKEWVEPLTIDGTQTTNLSAAKAVSTRIHLSNHVQDVLLLSG